MHFDVAIVPPLPRHYPVAALHRRTYRLAPPGVARLHEWATVLRAGHDALSDYLDRHAALTSGRRESGAA